MGRLNKIIIHWTAGTNQPNSTDYEHYHYLVTGDGLVLKGKYSPEDNMNVNDGKYAQHCGGGNTGAIGVAMCGMAGFKDINHLGDYPITRVQLEKCFELCARLCKKFEITLSPETVMTHYEFGKTHPKTSSAGKVDIVVLTPFQEVDTPRVGDFIRNKIRWYMNYKK